MTLYGLCLTAEKFWSLVEIVGNWPIFDACLIACQRAVMAKKSYFAIRTVLFSVQNGTVDVGYCS